MSQINGPPLLTFPREIRDLIYVALLRIPNIPPSSPQDAGPRFHPIGKYECSTIYLSAERFPGHQNINLLMSNRQISAEFSCALKTRNAVKHIKLDCMIKGVCIWPTWIISPGDAKNIRTMEIDMRLWDKPITGISTPAVASFVRLLHRFLRYGPLLTKSNDNDHYGVHIEALHINIIPKYHLGLESKDLKHLLRLMILSFPQGLPPITKLVLRKTEGNSEPGIHDECMALESGTFELAYLPSISFADDMPHKDVEMA